MVIQQHVEVNEDAKMDAWELNLLVNCKMPHFALSSTEICLDKFQTRRNWGNRQDLGMSNIMVAVPKIQILRLNQWTKNYLSYFFIESYCLILSWIHRQYLQPAGIICIYILVYNLDTAILVPFHKCCCWLMSSLGFGSRWFFCFSTFQVGHAFPVYAIKYTYI